MRTLRAIGLALSLAVAPLFTPAAGAAVAVVQMSTPDITDPFITDGIGDTSFGANCTAGNLLIVGFDVQTGSRTVSGVSGCGATFSLCSQGGTNATQETADSFEMWMYCGVATTTGTLIQVTLSSAVSVSGKVWAIELSGQHATFASAIEDIAIATNSGVGNHDTGNVVTASAGSALVGYLIGGSGSYTLDTDFTAITGVADAFGDAGYDLVDAGTFSFNTTSAGNESTGQMVIAIAPAAGGGGGGGNPSKRNMRGCCAVQHHGLTIERALAELWRHEPVELDTRLPLEAPRRPRYRGWR
jgi:hypothetical protein